jgi:RecJ-like exonuclease
MSKPAKIERTQKMFLAAMKRKFAADPTIPTTPMMTSVEVEPCPMCDGKGYRKGAFCHTCGGTGKRKVRL